MTKTSLAVTLVAALFSAPEPEPRVSKCIEIEPICMPGQHAVCYCESDISLDCRWMCVGSGSW